MRFRWPVSSSALHGRTVETPERSIGETTLLPMFDREGTVRRVLVLDAGSAEIRTLDPASSNVRVPFWGPIQAEPGPGDLWALGPQDLAALGDVWHFDPWMLLADPRYDRSQTAQALKATNCADRLPGTRKRLLYRRDLTRVAWVVSWEKNSYQMVRLASIALPAVLSRPAVPPPTAGFPGWRLDPFWK